MALTGHTPPTNAHKVLDGVIKTDPSQPKTARIRKRPGLINGDPNDLYRIDWSKEWNVDGSTHRPFRAAAVKER
jgi:hypothetical protein